MSADAVLAAVLLGAAVLAVPDRPRRGAVGAAGRAPRSGGPRRSGSVRPRRVRPRAAPGRTHPDVALVCELVAAAVEAGLPPATALERSLEAVVGASGGPGRDSQPDPQPDPDAAAVRRACAQVHLGVDPAEAWGGLHERWRTLTDTLVLAERTGAPVAGLLRSAAVAERTARRRAGEEAAARLGSLLVLPLGLCTLPSFLLLGVVPVVVTLATGLGGG